LIIVKYNQDYSSDSLLQLKKGLNKSFLDKTKPIQSKLKGSFGDNSVIDDMDDKEENMKFISNQNLSTFGKLHLKQIQLESLLDSNKKEIQSPKKLEDFQKNQRMEMIKSFDRMMDLPKLDDKLFTNFYLNLNDQLDNSNKKTLLLDLDETLIYCLSSDEIYDKDKVKYLKESFYN